MLSEIPLLKKPAWTCPHLTDISRQLAFVALLRFNPGGKAGWLSAHRARDAGLHAQSMRVKHMCLERSQSGDRPVSRIGRELAGALADFELRKIFSRYHLRDLIAPGRKYCVDDRCHSHSFPPIFIRTVLYPAVRFRFQLSARLLSVRKSIILSRIRSGRVTGMSQSPDRDSSAVTGCNRCMTDQQQLSSSQCGC